MHNTKLNMLMGYLARGWALVPLHDFSSGLCSCLNAHRLECSNPGKHPRWNQWQQDPQLIRDHVRLTELHAASPQWNWGVATGEPSGIFVLDWDIAHDAAIRQFIAQYSNDVAERIPDLGTLTLGPTGGGGWHYVFALPPDFVPRGSQTRNRYGLPPGLDVRGAGGQIVVAPSVSSKGPYGAVLLERPVAQAPLWLLDMLRPQAVHDVVDRAARMTAGALDGLTPMDGERLHSYAVAAVRGALEELQTAPEGTRNDTAARTARRLLELVQSDWTGLDWAMIEDLWRVAGEVTGLPYGELDGVWRRAVTAMAGKSVPAPVLAGWGGEYIPFVLTAPPTGEMPPDPFMNPDGMGAVPGVAPVIDPFERAVSIEMDKIRIREEARRRVAEAGLASFEERLSRMEAALLTSETLDTMPDRVPLVDGLLWRGTFARMIGESGHGKSFVALDVAAAVGAGTSWAGHAVTQGAVVYLVAEGEDGIKQRVRAWERVNGRRMSGVVLLPMPVQADGPEWDVFVELARRREPALIIGDTQARLSVGVDENSAKEMGVLVDAMERLRATTGACVLLVHHKGLRGVGGRGSTAVRGALHTEIDVTMDKELRMISVTTPKQKDAADDEAPTRFRLTPVVLSEPFVEPVISSAVPIWESAPGAGRVEPADRLISDEQLVPATAKIAAVLAKLATGYGMTQTQIYSAVSTKGTETYVCTKGTASKAWNDHLLPKKIIASIPMTSRWRYIPVEDRSKIVDPVNGTDGKQGYYAP